MDITQIQQAIDQLDLSEKDRQFWREQLPKLPEAGIKKVLSVLFEKDPEKLRAMGQEEEIKIKNMTDEAIALKREIISIGETFEARADDKAKQAVEKLIAEL